MNARTVHLPLDAEIQVQHVSRDDKRDRETRVPRNDPVRALSRICFIPVVVSIVIGDGERDIGVNVDRVEHSVDDRED